MQPPGAPNVSYNGNEILMSWSLGSNVSTFLKPNDSFPEFELQIKQNHQTWKVSVNACMDAHTRVCDLRLRLLKYARHFYLFF